MSHFLPFSVTSRRADGHSHWKISVPRRNPSNLLNLAQYSSPKTKSQKWEEGRVTLYSVRCASSQNTTEKLFCPLMISRNISLFKLSLIFCIRATKLHPPRGDEPYSNNPTHLPLPPITGAPWYILDNLHKSTVFNKKMVFFFFFVGRAHISLDRH